jgi:hypothetical protein
MTRTIQYSSTKFNSLFKYVIISFFFIFKSGQTNKRVRATVVVFEKLFFRIIFLNLLAIKNVYISDSRKLVASDLLPLFSCIRLKSLSIVGCPECSASDLLELLEKDPAIIKCRMKELRFELRGYESSREEEDTYHCHFYDVESPKVIATDNTNSLVWGLSLKFLGLMFAAINPEFKLLSKRCICNRMLKPSMVCDGCKIEVCEVCADGKKGISCCHGHLSFSCFDCSPKLECIKCHKSSTDRHEDWESCLDLM